MIYYIIQLWLSSFLNYSSINNETLDMQSIENSNISIITHIYVCDNIIYNYNYILSAIL